MEINFTPDQEAFIRYGIESGRLASPEVAVSQALSLWVERERRRLELIAELEIGLDSVRHGKGIEITEDSMKQLAERIGREGRERLAREQNNSSL